MQGARVNGSPEVMVSTTVAEGEIRDLAVASLQPHDIFYAVTPRRTPNDTVQVSSAFEILDVIISAPLYSQAILAAALVLGAAVLKVTAKLLDGVASEAGKDLYRWFKDSVTTALKRTRSARVATRDRLHLHVESTIRETRITIAFNAADLNHDPAHNELTFNEAVHAHIDYIFGKVLPFVSEVARILRLNAGDEEVYVECWVGDITGFREINVGFFRHDVAFQFQDDGGLKFIIALDANYEQAVKKVHANFDAGYFARPAA